MSRRTLLLLTAGGIFSGIWLAWAGFLVVYGAFPLPTLADGFEETGQFGDSFGFLASFMSTMAVIGALFSLHVQSKNYERQQFEQNFYTLLGNVQKERERLCVKVSGKGTISDYLYESTKYHGLKDLLKSDIFKYSGPECAPLQVLRLRDAIGVLGYADIKTVEKQYQFVMRACDFGNFFRLLYHLYLMIDKSPVKGKRFYARIVRAHLTSPEMRLVAYNCIVGEGRHKFKKLVIKYSVLHNMNRDHMDDHGSSELRFFQRKIDQHAFRFEPLQPITYG